LLNEFGLSGKKGALGLGMGMLRPGRPGPLEDPRPVLTRPLAAARGSKFWEQQIELLLHLIYCAVRDSSAEGKHGFTAHKRQQGQVGECGQPPRGNSCLPRSKKGAGTTAEAT
jgi:hypothetical protein